ncbi:MAG: FAD:protein FMN transferase [Bacteroidales bacterium]|nr:FAD:protein FMN transferase [Bacteroidales bacterium]
MTKKPFLLLSLYILASVAGCTHSSDFVFLQGGALGTTYAVTFKKPPEALPDLIPCIEETVALCFEQINNSMSIYNIHSLLSKINNNLSQETDSLFRVVFSKAIEISEKTNGAFDISAGPFFELWGFGEQEKESPTSASLEEMHQYVGMDKFRLEGFELQKKDPRSRLNMNAIAKGFASDHIAAALQGFGITDFLVEIGGEIVCKGLNPKKKLWSIGIDSPIDGNVSPGENVYVTVRLTDKALATSGNYRNFYMQDGQRIAHIIDPKTGIPVTHSLLSATVIADDCMTADAYATAFMVMGPCAAIDFLKNHPELGAYLIYEDNQVYKTFVTDNINTDL